MSLRASAIDANTGVSVDVDAAVAASAGLRLMGAAWRESAGVAAAAAFSIIHGADDSGTVILPVELAANGSGNIMFGPGGIACPNGISIDVTAGTVDVILYYIRGLNES